MSIHVFLCRSFLDNVSISQAFKIKLDLNNIIYKYSQPVTQAGNTSKQTSNSQYSFPIPNINTLSNKEVSKTQATMPIPILNISEV